MRDGDLTRMDHEATLTAAFCCLKCRGRSAAARTVSLPGGLLTPFGGKYVLVSCTLCGFTEIYNTAAFANAPEEERASPAPDLVAPVTPWSSSSS